MVHFTYFFSNFTKLKFCLANLVNEDIQDSCGNVGYCVSASPNGQLFYSGKIGEICSNINCNCKHYYIKENDMKEFLKKAASGINEYDNFEVDPMNSFESKFKTYSILVSIMILIILLNVKDLITMILFSQDDPILNDENIKDLKDIIIISVGLNLIVQIATFTTGTLAQRSLKIIYYKAHSIIIVCAVFFTLPAILYDKIHILSLIFLIFCYFSSKGLESTIYNSIVYDNIKRIEEPGLRLEYLNYYRECRQTTSSHSGHEDHLLLNSYTASSFPIRPVLTN